MRLLMSVTSVLVLAAAVGCSDSISPGSVAGIWRENSSIPGNSLEITLILNGSDISGFGEWCGEALGCGITTETGTATSSGIHIVTTFDSGIVETFDGRLVSASSLTGNVTETSLDGQNLYSAQSFTRVIRDPVQ